MGRCVISLARLIQWYQNWTDNWTEKPGTQGDSTTHAQEWMMVVFVGEKQSSLGLLQLFDQRFAPFPISYAVFP